MLITVKYDLSPLFIIRMIQCQESYISHIYLFYKDGLTITFKFHLSFNSIEPSPKNCNHVWSFIHKHLPNPIFKKSLFSTSLVFDHKRNSDEFYVKCILFQ